MGAQDNGTKWEDGLKEVEGSDEMKDGTIHYKINTYGDTTYCLPAIYQIVRDKFEGMRLRRVVIEGISAEDLFSNKFHKLATPYEAMSVFTPNKGEDSKVVALRYQFRDDARQRRWDISQAFPGSKCLWGPEVTDDKLKELQKMNQEEMKTLKTWKYEMRNNLLGKSEDEEKKKTGAPPIGQKKDTTMYGKMNRGILVNQVPEELSEERLWELFPTATDIWISHNFTLDVSNLPLNHRYAFVQYEDDAAAESALSEVEHLSDVDNAMIFYNYAQVREATVSMQELPEGRKVLSDQARLLLIKHLQRCIEVIRRVTEFCNDHPVSKAKVDDTFPRYHRRDLIQRKKETCRLVVRTVAMLNEDKKRRLVVKGETYKDTDEQKAFINSAIETCRDMVGRVTFEGYCVINQPNSVPQKRDLGKTSTSAPANKRPKQDDYTPRPGSGVASTRGRGGPGSNSRGRGAGQSRGGFGGASRGVGGAMGRGGMAGRGGRGYNMPPASAPVPMSRGGPGLMGDRPGSAPIARPMRGLLRNPPVGGGGARRDFMEPQENHVRPLLREPPPMRSGPDPDALNMLESIKQGLTSMTEKLYRVSSMSGGGRPEPPQPQGYRGGYDDDGYGNSGYREEHGYRDDGYGGGYY